VSITYRIDSQKGLTLVLWDQKVTSDDLMAHILRLNSDPGWPPPRRRHLADLSTAQPDASIDPAFISQLFDLIAAQAHHLAGMKLAFVAGEFFWRAGAIEPLNARYQASVIVFNSLDRACAWLGVPEEEVRRELEHMRAELRGGVDAPGQLTP
jgi:hypothetical protein